MRLVDADSAHVYLNELGCEMIKRMPTIDAEPVRHGRWMHHGNGIAYCSNCEVDAVEDATNFCPNCGAKMDGEDDA